MPHLVSDLITSAQAVLKDPDADRWAVVDLQRYLNETYLDVCRLDPRAYTQAVTFACAAGTRQSIASALPLAFAVVDCATNLGEDKRQIQRVDRAAIDTNLRFWRRNEQVDDLELWADDPAIPTSFLVYPPAKAGTSVELTIATVPTPHPLTTGGLSEVIRLRDVYYPPLLDGVLYRAFRVDLEDVASSARAIAHLQFMTSALSAGGAK